MTAQLRPISRHDICVHPGLLPQDRGPSRSSAATMTSNQVATWLPRADRLAAASAGRPDSTHTWSRVRARCRRLGNGSGRVVTMSWGRHRGDAYPLESGAVFGASLLSARGYCERTPPMGLARCSHWVCRHGLFDFEAKGGPDH